MPIKTTTIVDQRERIALMALSERYTIREIAELFGVSRPTVYDYVRRYKHGGRQELDDRSRAPHHPQRTPEAVISRIIEDRKRFGFGSKKIRRRMFDADPDTPWPARSTIDAILDRHDLVKPRHRRKRFQSPFARRYDARLPGELTTIDFKGAFRLRNSRWCYPLTMADAVSRYVLACEALPSIGIHGVWPIVERVFRENGLPNAVLSDNGPPFGGHGVSRLSAFSVRLMELGIQPVFITPGHPEQNGSHERMHRTLKERIATHRAASFAEQQRLFNHFRTMYNFERPHEALDMDRPSQRHRSSPRPFPPVPPPIEYDSSLEVRSVFGTGHIRLHNIAIFVSHALVGRRVGLEPIDDHLYNVHFGSFLIGKLDEKERRFV